MREFFNYLVCILFLTAFAASAWSGELAGLWQEYNDDSGDPEALIRIEKMGDDRYEGRIEKILPDTEKNAELICTKCSGRLHNQPLLGLRILSGLKRHDELTFEGGEITNPDDGKTYRCNIRLSEDGNTIEVTGYLGFHWAGQSETWTKVR